MNMYTALLAENELHPREASSRENCGIRETNNVHQQISGHIFAPNGGYCLYSQYRERARSQQFQQWWEAEGDNDV